MLSGRVNDIQMCVFVCTRFLRAFSGKGAGTRILNTKSLHFSQGFSELSSYNVIPFALDKVELSIFIDACLI